MTVISCTTGGVSGINNMSFGITPDVFPFSLTVVGTESIVVVVLVVAVFVRTESTGAVLIVGAVVVVVSLVVDGASFVVGGCSCLVLFATCFVLFRGRSCSSDCHFLFIGC